MTAAMAIALAGASWTPARGQPAAPPSTAAPPPPVRTLEINEFRVEGVEQLSGLQVESVLVPFLGPGRTLEDVERARVALEKA